MSKSNSNYALILAGGGGTRLWPASTSAKPKQYIKFDGINSLLKNTVLRMDGLADKDNLYVSIPDKLYDVTTRDLGDSINENNIIAEPTGRNTAPILAYTAMKVLHKDPDAILGVFPADHVIRDQNAFTKILEESYVVCKDNDYITTVGIHARLPHTGYGYIESSDSFESPNGYQFFNVTSFHEKPELEKAKKYVKAGNFTWNGGIFVAKAKVWVDSFREFMPELYEKIDAIKDTFGTPNEKAIFKKSFPDFPAESIDYGVMEKAKNVVVVPAEIGWNDLGNWQGILDQFKNAGSHAKMGVDRLLNIDSENCVLFNSHNEKRVTIAGLDNLVFAETDTEIFIGSMDYINENMRDIVKKAN